MKQQRLSSSQPQQTLPLLTLEGRLEALQKEVWEGASSPLSEANRERLVAMGKAALRRLWKHRLERLLFFQNSPAQQAWRRSARRLTSLPSEQEDFVQEAAMAALDNLFRYIPAYGPLSNYLIVVGNQAMQHALQKRRGLSPLGAKIEGLKKELEKTQGIPATPYSIALTLGVLTPLEVQSLTSGRASPELQEKGRKVLLRIAEKAPRTAVSADVIDTLAAEKSEDEEDVCAEAHAGLQALSDLPPATKRLLERWIQNICLEEGKSAEDLATEQGLSRASWYRALQRGREALREALQKRRQNASSFAPFKRARTSWGDSLT